MFGTFLRTFLWLVAILGPVLAHAQLPILSGCTSEIVAKARTTACVEMTPVNVRGIRGQRLMIVLRTNGCYFDKGKKGCTMCNFIEHAIRPEEYRLNAEDLQIQLRATLDEKSKELADVLQLDLLTLGSFFNRGEVPEAFWRSAMETVSEIPSLKKVVIESRTPFISKENIEAVRKMLRPDIQLEVSVGVESSSDSIRNGVVQKELSWEELSTAVETVGAFTDQNTTFQAYLLIKPHTLSEREAIEDAIQSAVDIATLARAKQVRTRISFEPVFVTQRTPLEQEFLAGRYFPVNLWSVVEVIQRTHSHPAIHDNPFIEGLFVGLSDEGLSEGRQTRSCPNCEGRVKAAIEEYNGSQSLSVFASLHCHCKPTLGHWNRPLEFEVLKEVYSLYKLAKRAKQLPETEVFWWATGKTLVCRPEDLPHNAEVLEASSEWKALKMVGEWNHCETGVIAPVLAAFSMAHIPVMFVSDWDTDYILVQSVNLEKGLKTLKQCGHRIAE